MSRLKLYPPPSLTHPLSTHRQRLCPIPFGAALLLASNLAGAQSPADPAPEPGDVVLPSLSTSGQRGLVRQTQLGGFANTPGWQQPMQTLQVPARKLKDAQVTQLNDIGKLNASVGNTYAAAGYLEALSIRGFALDPLHNYRRDGLALYAETRLALDNVAAVEVLKGTSGMQAGMSTPGGLVNLVIKRPQGRLRQADVAITPRGNLLTALDLGDDITLGNQDDDNATKVGLRLNLARERLHPSYQNGQGQRHMVALAADTMLNAATKLEVEMAHSRHVQAAQPALSMTGNLLPPASAIDPDFNINSQPWSAPVRTTDTTGSVRLTQAWREGWQGTVHYAEQHARTDDQDAYGVGSIGCALQVAPCDRFGSDGSYTVIDYRSLGERRLTRAFDTHLDGKLQTGAWQHQFTAGIARTLITRDLPNATGGIAGGDTLAAFSNLYAPVDVLPATSTPTAQNSVNERSTEFYLRDHTQWTPQWHSWAGLRHTSMARNQYLSDSSQGSRLAETFTAPWVALGWSWAPQHMLYTSWGEGVEVPPVRFTTPRTTVVNNGEPLPSAKSRQWELGVQGDEDWGQWGVNWFQVIRPEAALVSVANQADTKRYTRDGDSRVQGLEAQWHGQWRAYSADASLMLLDAARRGSALPDTNGEAPVNVQDYAVRLSQRYRWDVQRGLTAQLDLLEDGPRTADLVTGERLPAWWRCDLSVKLAQAWGNTGVVWGLGVRNAFDTRAWRAAPALLDHVYVQTLAAREWTASASISY